MADRSLKLGDVVMLCSSLDDCCAWVFVVCQDIDDSRVRLVAIDQVRSQPTRLPALADFPALRDLDDEPPTAGGCYWVRIR